MNPLPVLCVVIPCYNEEKVLPITAPMFVSELNKMIEDGRVDGKSSILFVNDGSGDNTWQIIQELSKEYEAIRGLSLSRNRGQQNALLAGLMEAKAFCDITITTDCDGQNELAAMGRMVDAYKEGYEIVYGVRKDRKNDPFLKRFFSEWFYKIVRFLGAEIIKNHADYRLVSSKVLDEFEDFREVNIFLRGMFPLVGFESTIVEYSMDKRLAGETHYSPTKMMGFALDGITSFTIRPVRAFTLLGFIVSLISLIGIIWTIIDYFCGNTVSGYASIVCILCFMAGFQLVGIGVIGEYVGKIYMEIKHRPRYIIADRTDNLNESKAKID